MILPVRVFHRATTGSLYMLLSLHESKTAMTRHEPFKRKFGVRGRKGLFTIFAKLTIRYTRVTPQGVPGTDVTRRYPPPCGVRGEAPYARHVVECPLPSTNYYATPAFNRSMYCRSACYASVQRTISSRNVQCIMLRVALQCRRSWPVLLTHCITASAVLLLF